MELKIRWKLILLIRVKEVKQMWRSIIELSLIRLKFSLGNLEIRNQEISHLILKLLSWIIYMELISKPIKIMHLLLSSLIMLLQLFRKVLSAMELKKVLQVEVTLRIQQVWDNSQVILSLTLKWYKILLMSSLHLLQVKESKAALIIKLMIWLNHLSEEITKVQPCNSLMLSRPLHFLKVSISIILWRLLVNYSPRAQPNNAILLFLKLLYIRKLAKLFRDTKEPLTQDK